MPDHALSSLPSAVIIFMTTPIFAPRRPGWNVTVTTSPAFTVRLVQPLFLIFGGEPRSSSSSILVPPLVEIPSSTCGLVHTNSVTVALIVVSLPMSYIDAAPWCASTEADMSTENPKAQIAKPKSQPSEPPGCLLIWVLGLGIWDLLTGIHHLT